jgi:hypothetical protein
MELPLFWCYSTGRLNQIDTFDAILRTIYNAGSVVVKKGHRGQTGFRLLTGYFGTHGSSRVFGLLISFLCFFISTTRKSVLHRSVFWFIRPKSLQLCYMRMRYDDTWPGKVAKYLETRCCSCSAHGWKPVSPPAPQRDGLATGFIGQVHSRIAL